MNVQWGNRVSWIRLVALVAVLGTLRPAVAQFDSEGIELYRHFDLGAFGANSGNDCWGYVSPSGREYALAGLSNKVGIVEITDPNASVIVATIARQAPAIHPHLAGTQTRQEPVAPAIRD